MKNNILYQMVVLVIGLVTFQACQNDPAFPDPNFEITDQRVEVRRDTADSYTISMEMDVPNKVQNISILDGMDYSVIENITSYNRETKFQFNYQVDLTPFEKDTVLNYIVKVLDQDERSFNQGIRIDVKGFSYPEIKLVGGTSIAPVAPAYVVKGLVTTGLNTIKTVKVSFDGEEQYAYIPEAEADTLHQMSLKQLVFLGELQEGINYDLDIFIEDDKGQSSLTTINVSKGSEIKKPTRINYLNASDALIKIDLEYDAEEKIIGFDYIWENGQNYRNEFSYNDLNMVDTLKYSNYNSSGLLSSISYLYFNYLPGTTQLESIESKYYDYDDDGNVTEDDLEVEAYNFEYDTDGNVLSFYTNSKVSNIYYSDPFNLGESIYGEYFQSTSYFGSNTQRRQHREDYDPVLIPTFMEGLPPFAVPTSSMLDVYSELFWNKYMMTRTVPSDPSYSSTYLREPAFSYETDDTGNITVINRINTSGGYNYEGKTSTYNFFYNAEQ
ncbi:hypothetical protein [Robertkochia solimangrovi]|uniref:hypothetical protein n=1 Tax=Robertkochia solimangrovi TaxID=2213046 RepID=UPI00117F2844|nr:hypothetical protein [Robertkochia solimangrovi]